MPDISGSNILVIGGAGLIGSHIVDLLTKEDVNQITIYDNYSTGSARNLWQAIDESNKYNKRIKIIVGDIAHTDILNDAVKGQDYVFNLVSLISLLHCHTFPRNAFHVNIEGAFNVLEACERNKVKKIIYSSTSEVYGNAVTLPMTEDHPLNTQTFYGATKVAVEQMNKAFYYRSGLEYVNLRYFNVYGERQNPDGPFVSVIMKTIDRLMKGESPIIYGDGSQSYDFIHVSDVARANICALKSDNANDNYNVCTGKSTSLNELIDLITELIYRSGVTDYQPSKNVHITNRLGCPIKAKEDIGFVAQTRIIEGIMRTTQWLIKGRYENKDD